jgi:hypothetical protein
MFHLIRRTAKIDQPIDAFASPDDAITEAEIMINMSDDDEGELMVITYSQGKEITVWTAEETYMV